MRIKNLLILLFTSVLILSCNKNSVETKESTSQLRDTLPKAKDTANNQKINKTIYTPFGGTFGTVPKNEHDLLKDEYNKVFKESGLYAIAFEINSPSFNKLVQKYKGSKKFLDIYFILDKTGQRNLMFKFTNESLGENFILKSGDHQYIINNKDLQPADGEDLSDLRKKFVTRYQKDLELLSKPFTILVRDDLNNIHDVYGTLKIYPCLDDGKVSLTSEFNDAVGDAIYGNRGSLYP